ncbi:MAG: hypothetical protein QNK36_10460 [Colwellia sp.]|nr:hypothetical protein [Colwellia sp.]
MVWAKSNKVTKLFPETQTQTAIVKWFKLQYPGLKKHIIMIGNGGKKTAQAHKLAERMGEVKGASDLFIAFPSGGYCGLWVEVKPEKFKVVPSNLKHVTRQLDFLEDMREVGFAGEMIIGSIAGIEIIKSYMDLED